MRTIWKNGQLLSEKEAVVSIYDSAQIWGDTCFEMTRSFNKVTFKLREHLERLFRSAKFLRIDIPYTIGEIEDFCHTVVTANDPFFQANDEHRLMINVTRGLLPIYEETGIKGTNVIISDFPLRWTVKGMGKLFDTGINCVIPSQRSIPAQFLEPKIKTRCRIHYKMANLEAGDGNWPLLLDQEGFITEGSGCNFFIVQDGFLYTPEPRNILRGISRDYIMETNRCRAFNIEPYDVYTSDEAFMTGTPFCMLPVVSLNGVKIGNGQIGETYKKLLNIWSDFVGVDIKKQIQQWDDGN